MVDLGVLAAKRVMAGLLVILLVVSMIFFLMRARGDPAAVQLGETATEEQIAQFRSQYGLDKPLLEQWVVYVGNALQGDFGDSFRYSAPAMPIVLERLPATVKLGAVGLFISVIVAVPIGIYSAMRPRSVGDSVSRVIAVGGQSIPVFWFGIILILVFSVRLGWFPAVGAGSWKHLVLPGLALGVYAAPLTMRLTRSSMLEVLGQEHVKAARARGLSQRRVYLNHAFRNASLPVITILGLRVGYLVAGTVVIEEVFAYPGMGRLAINSMLQADFAVIQSFVLVVTALIVLINLTVDILYGVVDPRIRTAA